MATPTRTFKPDLMQTPSSEFCIQTSSTTAFLHESRLTPSVFPILSMGAKIRRSFTCMFCVYDGVSVQNGEFWSVNVLAQSRDVAGNEPDGNTNPSAATAAAAMFLAPLPQAWGADPSTLNPSTYWDSISFGLDAISQ